MGGMHLWWGALPRCSLVWPTTTLSPVAIAEAARPCGQAPLALNASSFVGIVAGGSSMQQVSAFLQPLYSWMCSFPIWLPTTSQQQPDMYATSSFS
jgi:hypothetical protein